MVLRTARRGPNSGNQFWGCAAYPRCKGTLPYDGAESVHAVPLDSTQAAPDEPLGSHGEFGSVLWDESRARPGWISEYVSVGSLPGLAFAYDAKLPQTTRALLAQTLVLSRHQATDRPPEKEQLCYRLLRKLLVRGYLPLVTPTIEAAAIIQFGLESAVIDRAAGGVEVGWEWANGRPPTINIDAVFAGVMKRPEFRPSESVSSGSHLDDTLFDSPVERKFLNDWLPRAFGADIGHWVHPQAPLERLLSARGVQIAGARRVDFLLAHPLLPPIVIELDGEDHAQTLEIDRSRDKHLEALGVSVVRIPNAEVEQGGGAALDRLRQVCAPLLAGASAASSNDNVIKQLLQSCATGSKFQYVLALALERGVLRPSAHWAINVTGDCTFAAAALDDFLQMLAAIGGLYDVDLRPASATIDVNGVKSASNLGTAPADNGDGLTRRFNVRFESVGPYFEYPDNDSSLDYVVRPTYLPFELAMPLAFPLSRQSVGSSAYSDVSEHLQVFLRFIFRKQTFRELQGEAVFNVLAGQDTVVLLPTGAGKSLIYQLAGLLMPGITLVVDPIVALIEDQVLGMRNYGIDRARGISSFETTKGNIETLLAVAERGEYLFLLVSPERMQSPAFRSALTTLCVSSLVNLAVIDEAHCVSEWGHDFRPSYLHLSNNLRQFCRSPDGTPPPLLALTGTASRAVLRDMLADLNIDRHRAGSLIRPTSFDRPELRFRLYKAEPGTEYAALKGVLNTLPDELGVPTSSLYQCNREKTASGIIFTPFVNGDHGVMGVTREVRSLTGASVVMYSGSAPKGLDTRAWEFEKRRNAIEFKENQVPILVSTKAFGMGIDKPNIRYVIHFGMPPSLEAYYQEAGRAGRDRRMALCIILYSEYDEARSERILNAESLEAVKDEIERVGRHSNDDITRACWFHTNSFAGLDAELEEIARFLERIRNVRERTTLELPFDVLGERKASEKAIYRLLQLGVVRDYQVDFGSKKFVIDVFDWNPDSAKAALLDYVSRSQPARIPAVRRRLDEIAEEDRLSSTYMVARELLLFLYGTIESARRRAILEAMTLARNSSTNEDIRRRILDYLQEGFGAETLQELVDQPEINILRWFDISRQIVTAMDAGEMRGITIRFLESYPDHPGLLLLRGLSESLTNDYDLALIAASIRNAIRSAKETYILPNDQFELLLSGCLNSARQGNEPIQIALAVVLHDTYVSEVFDRELLSNGRGELLSLGNEDVRRVFLSFGLRAAVTRAASVFGQLDARYNTQMRS